MTKMIKASLLVVIILVPVITLAAGEKQATFSPFVNSKGNITVPADFRARWIHLGTWAVTSKAPIPGAAAEQTSPSPGFHEVYTQPEPVKAYKKNGKWPDGAVLVMEVRAITWDDVPTGHVMYAGGNSASFVMVKDSKGRFKGNPTWGDGWGWALFKADDPKKNVSTNYKNDCLGCHEVAKDTDWVFVNGYPTLR